MDFNIKIHCEIDYWLDTLKEKFRSVSFPLEKGVLKICSKFTGKHPRRSVISIKIALQSNFIEIPLRRGCSPVTLQHIFRTHFSKNTSGWLLLAFAVCNDWKRKLTYFNRIIKTKSICLKNWTWHIHLIFNKCYFGIFTHILNLVVKYPKETCNVCLIWRYTIEYMTEFVNIWTN